MEQNLSRREKRKQFRMKRNRVCLLALAIVSLTAFVYSAYNLWDYYADHRKESALKEELLLLRENKKESVETGAGAGVQGTQVSDTLQVQRSKEEIAAFYQTMKEKNEDYICWITIEGTAIDYPVVKKDNSFYLKHDYNGEASRHGAIFADEACSEEDLVLLLHGHHMKDGTMFGDLKKYKDEEFRRQHKKISLEFEDGIREYRIFSAARIDLLDETSFRFEVLPKTEEEMAMYMEGLDDASFWYDETTAEEKGDVLMLSTCDYGTEEERLIIAAKKME